MNSWSRNNYEPNRKEERYEEKRHEEEKCPTIIKCSCPTLASIPALTPADMVRTFTIATLNLDTSCLCNPKVRIDFTSQIVGTDAEATFTVQIFKQCKNQAVAFPIGPAWTYTSLPIITTLSFFICDSDACDRDCCTYTAVIRAITGTTPPLRISNATLGAIATCEYNKCNNKCHNRCNNRYEPCKKEDRCKEKRCDTFVKCGFSNSNTILAGTEATVSSTLATLNLDTSCICNPKIRLDFATNFVLVAVGSTVVSIRLQVYRQCKSQLNPVEIGSSWNITIPVGASDIVARPLSFFICDEDICSNGDCCTYTLVATPINAVTNATISFNNSTITATVTCVENKCHRRCDY